MGISGHIAAFFQRHSLTPLIALIALLLGIGATLITPREEEPQINVTMANVFVPFPGAAAKDVEALVARPAEQVLSRIAGIAATSPAAAGPPWPQPPRRHFPRQPRGHKRR